VQEDVESGKVSQVHGTREKDSTNSNIAGSFLLFYKLNHYYLPCCCNRKSEQRILHVPGVYRSVRRLVFGTSKDNFLLELVYLYYFVVC